VRVSYLAVHTAQQGKLLVTKEVAFSIRLRKSQWDGSGYRIIQYGRIMANKNLKKRVVMLPYVAIFTLDEGKKDCTNVVQRRGETRLFTIGGKSAL